MTFTFYVAIYCPEGMVYQQCGPVCPQTCDTITSEDTVCSSGCIEGCFCPSGTVYNNGHCIAASECESMYRQ